MTATANSLLAPSVEEPVTSRRLAEMWLEHDALVTKLAKLAQAVRGLAGDLAMARRDLRQKQHQIQALRSENARLRACVPLSHSDGRDRR